jgi:hypothetical protein
MSGDSIREILLDLPLLDVDDRPEGMIVTRRTDVPEARRERPTRGSSSTADSAFAGIAAFAAAGATFAGAATKRTSSSSPPQRASQTQLTGDTADKVKAAAEAKVPAATVLRGEEGGPGGSAYHAHVRTSDGTEVVVLVNSSFEATSVETRPARGRRGRDHGRAAGRAGPGIARRARARDRAER